MLHLPRYKVSLEVESNIIDTTQFLLIRYKGIYNGVAHSTYEDALQYERRNIRSLQTWHQENKGAVLTGPDIITMYNIVYILS